MARKCAGTLARDRYAFLTFEDNEQSVPADAAIKGCGHDVSVKVVRATKKRVGAMRSTFARSLECVTCPHCDGPSK